MISPTKCQKKKKKKKVLNKTGGSGPRTTFFLSFLGMFALDDRQKNTALVFYICQILLMSKREDGTDLLVSSNKTEVTNEKYTSSCIGFSLNFCCLPYYSFKN